MNRIAVNAAVTWGRGAFALVLGLFSSRWALQALGQEGYGLWVLCCSVNFFACFVQGVVANATQRYLSVAVGEGSWRGWYSLSMRLNAVVSVLTVAVAAPIAFYLLGNWLSVPAERLAECRLVMTAVFAFSLVAMLNAPNRQLFAAHQRLVEPAVWGMLSTAIAFGVLAWMVSHPGRWLVPYAALLALSSFATEGGLAIRTRRMFFRLPTAASVVPSDGVRSILRFSLWRFFADGGWTMTSYGMTILVGHLFGPVLTASAGLARSAATHVNSLSNALSCAYEPAIANRVASDRRAFRKLTRSACLLQTAAYLLLGLPLFAFADPILRLWLGEVPPQMVVAIRWLIGAGIAGAVASAHANAVSALGKVRGLYVGSGILQIAALPLALGLCKSGFAGGGLGAVFAAVFFTQLANSAWSVFCYLRVREE